MAEEEVDLVDPGKVVGHEGDASPVSYSTRDLLVYALGIGCKNSADELRFLYEDHEAFQAFPTFLLVLPFKGTSHDVVPFPSPSLFSFPPGLPAVNPAMILHAEQSLRILRPLASGGGKLRTISRIIGLYDKGKGALMREETRYVDERDGSVVAVTVSGSFLRGVTGFKSKGPALPSLPAPPAGLEDQPDTIIEDKTSSEQALLYRLSGDYNPLHADPEVAQSVAFPRPILHGLCTLGHAARAVVGYHSQHAGAGTQLDFISVRFSKPSFPGETLVVMIWRHHQHPGRYIFRVKVKERNVIVLDGGQAEFGVATQARL